MANIALITNNILSDSGTPLTGVIAGSGTTNYLSKFTSSNAIGNSLLFDDGTNVGIGTATPSYKLDVNGTTRFQGDSLITKSSGALSASVTSQTTDNSFLTVLNGTSGLQFTSRGSGTTGNMGLPANSAEILSYSKAALGIILHTTPYLAIGTQSTEMMRLVASTGNFLIGTTTDAGFKLDVTGTARITSSLTANSLIKSGGTSTQYLMANGSVVEGNSSTGVVRYGDYITIPTFSGKSITLNQGTIKELLWGGQNIRFTVTDTYTGSYPAAGSTWVRTYELIDGTSAVYSSGAVYCGFWVNYPPANMTVRVQNTSGTWYGPYTGSNISVSGQFEFWKVACGGPNYIKKWEITFTPTAGFSINLQTVNIVIDNSEGIDQVPLVSRAGSSIYGTLSFIGTSSATKAYINNSGVIGGTIIKVADTTGLIEFQNSVGTKSGSMFMDGNIWRLKSSGASDAINIFNNGNIGINQTTDAGFKFDINGTGRIQNTLNMGTSTDFQISGTSVVNKGISRLVGNGNGLIFSENMQAAQIAFQFIGNGSTTGNSKAFLNTGGKSVFNINVGLGNPNTTGCDASVLLLDGIHNITSFSNTIIRGIYYNPTLTSLTGVVSHRAIETATGDIYFASTSGNVGIGSAPNSTYRLDVLGTIRANNTAYGQSTVRIETNNAADMCSQIVFMQNSPNWPSYIGTHVSGGGANYGLQFKSQNAINLVMNRDGSNFFGNALVVGSARVHIRGAGSTSSTTPFLVENSSLTELFRVRDNGNVIIGSNVDNGNKLQVTGNITASGGVIASTLGAQNSAEVNVNESSNNLLVYADITGGSNKLYGGGQVKANIYTSSVTTPTVINTGTTVSLMEWYPTTTQGVMIDYVFYIASGNYMRSGTFTAVNDNAGNTQYVDNATPDLNGSTSTVTFAAVDNGGTIEFQVTNASGSPVYMNILTRYIPNIF